MAHQQGFDHGEHATVRGMKEATQEDTVAEPSPLAPLEAHLNGSVHNAGSAVRALEAFIKSEVEKLRAELHPKAFTKIEGDKS